METLAPVRHSHFVLALRKFDADSTDLGGGGRSMLSMW